MKRRLLEDLEAANDLCDRMTKFADKKQDGVYWWSGWAIVDAFLAGVDYERKPALTDQKAAAEALGLAPASDDHR